MVIFRLHQAHIRLLNLISQGTEMIIHWGCVPAEVHDLLVALTLVLVAVVEGRGRASQESVERVLSGYFDCFVSFELFQHDGVFFRWLALLGIGVSFDHPEWHRGPTLRRQDSVLYDLTYLGRFCLYYNFAATRNRRCEILLVIIDGLV